MSLQNISNCSVLDEHTCFLTPQSKTASLCCTDQGPSFSFDCRSALSSNFIPQPFPDTCTSIPGLDPILNYMYEVSLPPMCVAKKGSFSHDFTQSIIVAGITFQPTSVSTKRVNSPVGKSNECFSEYDAKGARQFPWTSCAPLTFSLNLYSSLNDTTVNGSFTGKKCRHARRGTWRLNGKSFTVLCILVRQILSHFSGIPGHTSLTEITIERIESFSTKCKATTVLLFMTVISTMMTAHLVRIDLCVLMLFAFAHSYDF